MQHSIPFQVCAGIRRDGQRCASPALRGHRLCYFHHPEAREWKQVDRWPLIQREALRDLTRSLSRSSSLDEKRKRLLLRALQMMS